MTEYIVMNNNPIVGRVKENGKQEIQVHDYKTGNMRYLEADKNKVDAFIDTRHKKIKKANLFGVLASIGAAVLGALAGSKLTKDQFFKNGNIMAGAMIGLIGGIFSWTFAIGHTDKSITQKFIDENK